MRAIVVFIVLAGYFGPLVAPVRGNAAVMMMMATQNARRHAVEHSPARPEPIPARVPGRPRTASDPLEAVLLAFVGASVFNLFRLCVQSQPSVSPLEGRNDFPALFPQFRLEKLAAGENGHCPVCATSLTSDIVRCRRCDTPHHRDCVVYNRQCGIFGCGGSGIPVGLLKI